MFKCQLSDVFYARFIHCELLFSFSFSGSFCLHNRSKDNRSEFQWPWLTNVIVTYIDAHHRILWSEIKISVCSMTFFFIFCDWSCPCMVGPHEQTILGWHDWSLFHSSIQTFLSCWLKHKSNNPCYYKSSKIWHVYFGLLGPLKNLSSAVFLLLAQVVLQVFRACFFCIFGEELTSSCLMYS